MNTERLRELAEESNEISGAFVFDEELTIISRYLLAILQKKNRAYGDSTETCARILKILWPEGIPTESYHDARIVISVLDKLKRIATDRDAFGESPWLDVAGYGLLGFRHDVRNSSPSPEKEAVNSSPDRS